MRKSTIFLGAGITVVALALALVVFWHTPDDMADNKLRIRLSWIHQAQFAGLYLAEDKGFFREEGVAVDIQEGGVEYSSIKMVAAEVNDIGLTSADQVLLARAKEIPVVAVAAMFRRSPVVLTSLKERGIRSVNDLRGKKIGFKYGAPPEAPIRALLDRAGIRPDEYQEVSVSYDLSPLIDGRVDVFPGFATNEPLSLMEKGYEVENIVLADNGINFYTDVVFTREDVLKNKRQLVKKFLRALLRGYEYAIIHPDEAVAATKKRNPEADVKHEMSLLKAATPLWLPPNDPRLGIMEMANWERIQDILLTTQVKNATSLLKRKVDLEKVVDLEMIER